MEAGPLGLILDTTVIVAAERRGHSVRQILEQVKSVYGNIDIGLSVVTVVELVHGIQRAGTDERRQRRQAFVDELIQDIPVYPIVLETARLAGRIEGIQATRGVTIAFEDLLIAATALQLEFAVVTGNTRHFEQIPGLTVLKQ